jgi:hypothetical protein
MVSLQGFWWAGVFFLLGLMRRERHEPTPDLIQATWLLMGLVVSGLMVLLWALA